MSVPASVKPLDDYRAEVDAEALKIRDYSAAIRQQSAAGPINREELRYFQRRLHESYTKFQEIAAGVTGFIAYYNSVKPNNPTTVADFEALRDGCLALRNWIHNNYPTDQGGSEADLNQVTDETGTTTKLTIPSATLVTFRANCAALEATVS